MHLVLTMCYMKCENISLLKCHKWLRNQHFFVLLLPLSGTENSNRQSVKHIRTESINIWKYFPLITFSLSCIDFFFFFLPIIYAKHCITHWTIILQLYVPSESWRINGVITFILTYPYKLSEFFNYFFFFNVLLLKCQTWTFQMHSFKKNQDDV